ncbi:ABC transporter substrate-binding protein [Actinophytocola sp.]|uniref:ABC transporter substrate-binding protein n=1 Tax=Actinophytocola sp. TaxID=1872138 RepID=UPI003D6B600B
MTRRNHARLAQPRLWRRMLTALVVVTMLLATAGCGLLGGSSDEAESTPAGPVEKPKIKVGIIPSTDVAPLFIAQQQGIFKKHGLEVELVPLGGGGAAMTSLLGGDVDLTFASYPLLVQAVQKGKGKVNIKVVADASAAQPDVAAVVVKSDSPLRNPEDLAGKRIGVSSTGSMADLAVLAGMKAAKADTSGLQWKVMKFPDMLPKLQSGELDAAFLVEPFITVAQAQLGVWTVFQPLVGRLDGIGLTGYLALDKTTTAYPKTMAAYQRAVVEANRAAATPAGQDAIRSALIEKAKVKPEIAPVLHLPTYPLTTDPTRLQRVPDLMREFGLIKQPFDMRPMIFNNKS